MSNSISCRTVCLLLLAGLLALLVTGCDLTRPPGAAEDVEQFTPPTGAAEPVQEPAAPQAEAPAATPVVTDPGPSIQEGTALIRVEPATQQVAPGGTATVQIVIENVADLSAADVQLQFDPNILEAVDADPGREGVQLQPGTFLAPDFLVLNEINNETGLAQYALTQVAPTEPVSGTGTLATITFRATAEGISQLNFVQTNLATSAGLALPVVPQPGAITVALAPGETQTPGAPTATPTETPIIILPSPTVPGQPTATPIPPATLTPLPPPTVTPPPGVTPVPPLTDLPPGAVAGFCYRVQQGETLFSIGQRFGVDYQRIAALNRLWSPHNIYAQQGLFIPEGPDSYYGPKVYIAQQNETLDNIAQSCNLPVAFLADVNNLARDAVLQAGHVVVIPMPPPPVPPRRFPPPPPLYPPHFPPPYYAPPPCYSGPRC